MESFSYYNPTKIEFGIDKEKEIGKHLKKDGIKTVLLHYGMGSIKKIGLYDSVINSLEQNGINYYELGGVVSNPLLSKVNEGIDICKKQNIQALLCVGGGSVADSGKAIATGALYEADVWDFFIGKATIEKALPLYTIMTLAATASEMNGNAVVTNEQTKQKYAISSVLLNPVISIINPKLMASVSEEYLAYSAVDVVAHAIEVYFTASYHPNISSRFVESIVKTVMETTDILLKNPDDNNARGEFAWAAIQALNGLTPSGTKDGIFPNHMIEHSLSALYNVPHGAGLSVVIPAWMKWYKDQNIEPFKRFAKEILHSDDPQSTIDELQRWFEKIGSPTTLEKANIPNSAIPQLAENANGLAKLWGLDSTYTVETIETILNNAKSI